MPKSKRTKADLVISGGAILTMNSRDEILKNGSVAIKNGIIVGIGPAKKIGARFTAAQTIDADGKIIMPGLINTHTHLAMSILRGVADDVTLDEWLNRFIFPLEEKFMNKDSVYRGSLLSCAEMILSGTTTFCDMYFFEKETGRAAETIGMRGVIGEGIVAFGEKRGEAWERKKKLTTELMRLFRDSKLISVGVKPHSPYTCDKEVLMQAKEFAREMGLPYVIHLAETKKEFLDFARDKKMTPVEYLDSLGVLDENTLAAHAVWMGKKDFNILKKRGVKISHCPQSNMKLGSGIAPITDFLKNGITVSLGTDGSASNNALDMFRELKSAALLASVAKLDASAITARAALRMATIEGAIALGKGNEIGSLEIGKKADVITLDLNKPHLTPIYDYYSHLVYAADGSDVNDSVIDGNVVMRNRKLKKIEIEEVINKVNSISSRVKKSLNA